MAGHMRRMILLVVLATLPIPTGSFAAFYTFIDENGKTHFTNVPADPRYRPGIRRRPRIRPGNPADYEDYIRAAARLYEVDPLLVKAVIKVESGFDCRAVSRRGAKGLMQLMPETAADLNILDPFDPRANILGGTCYLRKMLNRFGGDLRLALAAYNAGPNLVERIGRVPRLAETRRYVRKVLTHYKTMTAASSPYKRWVRIAYE